MNTFNQTTEMQTVRELARGFSKEAIANCMDEQLAAQSNSCNIQGDNIQVMNVLARASVVKNIMDDGASLPEAMRELGRRIRSLHLGENDY